MFQGLRPIAPNVWVIDSIFTTFGLRGSTRATIIRLPQGLLVHSPVRLTTAQHTQLRTLGNVAYVVAPNAMHYMYFEEFLSHHPKAQGFVSKALIAKKPRFQSYPPISDLQPLVEPHLAMIDIPGHAIGETLFFHPSSQTLITADLFYNFQSEQMFLEKLAMRLLGIYGRPGIPVYHRGAVTNRPVLRTALQQVRFWPFNRIIMAHGRILEAPNAPELFQSVWNWV